jgi:hypothetical protein
MLKDYSEKLGLEKKIVLDYGSRNTVNVEEEILKECNSRKSHLESRNPKTATELVINADNASHDISCCISGIAARNVAIEIYNDFINLGDREFMKSMVTFCQKRITEEYAMINLAQAAYNAYAGNYEEAEVFAGQAKNKAHDIRLKARNDLKEIIDAGDFSETNLAKDVFRDFGDYWNEYDELIKSIRVQDKERAIETAKRLFAYTSALNYVLAGAKSELLKKQSI